MNNLHGPGPSIEQRRSRRKWSGMIVRLDFGYGLRPARIWLSSSSIAYGLQVSIWRTTLRYVGKILDNWTFTAARNFGYPLPLYGHAIAAVLAAPLSSPVAGVQLATLLSLVGIWSGFALIFQTLQRRMLIYVSIIFLVLLTLNRFVFRLELHGNEVIVNFFFSHLIAQAVAVIAIALALMTERIGGRPEQRYLVLALSIPLVECLHLSACLPTFRRACSSCCGRLFLLSRNNPRLKTLRIGALLTIVSAIGIVLHPTFAPSVRVASGDEAGLSLLRIPDIKTLAILSVVVGLLSACCSLNGFVRLHWAQGATV